MSTKTEHDQFQMIRSLVIDIALPVLILNKLSPHLGHQGPLKALLIAMSLPLGHGIYGFIKDKKVSTLALLGLVNVGLTGGFALLKLEGFWFAVKEASFPAVIGLFVLGSTFTKKPLFAFFLNQPALFQMEHIHSQLQTLGNMEQYKNLIKTCTLFFSGTFFISALLNFGLAARIFVEIPSHLSELEKAEILNSQIAEMTWMGYIVIALPLMVITGSLFFYCLSRLSKLTETPLQDLLKS